MHKRRSDAVLGQLCWPPIWGLSAFSQYILKKATPRFELGIKDLQSFALPLGHIANIQIIGGEAADPKVQRD